MIQSSGVESHQILFVNQGGVAVCEPTCFREPILIYGKGGVINLYQVILGEPLPFSYKSVSEEHFDSDYLNELDCFDLETTETAIFYKEYEMQDIFHNADNRRRHSKKNRRKKYGPGSQVI